MRTILAITALVALNAGCFFSPPLLVPPLAGPDAGVTDSSTIADANNHGGPVALVDTGIHFQADSSAVDSGHDLLDVGTAADTGWVDAGETVLDSSTPVHDGGAPEADSGTRDTSVNTDAEVTDSGSQRDSGTADTSDAAVTDSDHEDATAIMDADEPDSGLTIDSGVVIDSGTIDAGSPCPATLVVSQTSRRESSTVRQGRSVFLFEIDLVSNPMNGCPPLTLESARIGSYIARQGQFVNNVIEQITAADTSTASNTWQSTVTATPHQHEVNFGNAQVGAVSQVAFELQTQSNSAIGEFDVRLEQVRYSDGTSTRSVSTSVYLRTQITP